MIDILSVLDLEIYGYIILATLTEIIIKINY